MLAIVVRYAPEQTETVIAPRGDWHGAEGVRASFDKMKARYTLRAE
jgi:hypothetical protein